MSRADESIRYVSYWENAPGQPMPPYVALSLASIRRGLGERFQLLTPNSVQDLVEPRVLQKAWAFEPLPFTLAEGVEEIVAKSDFIRMAYVQRHGGVWIDADTLLLRDPTHVLFPEGLSHRLHWHSECLFASRPGNGLLAQVLCGAMEEGAHAWGNPGRIKDVVAQAPEDVVPISGALFDPGFRPLYNFSSCEVMRRQDLAAGQFLLADVALLKLYNTYFRRTASFEDSVAQFLVGGTLLARLFLHIEPDVDYWLAESEQVLALTS